MLAKRLLINFLKDVREQSVDEIVSYKVNEDTVENPISVYVSYSVSGDFNSTAISFSSLQDYLKKAEIVGELDNILHDEMPKTRR